MHDLNGVLFLKVSFLFLLLSWATFLTLISLFTTICASLKSHKSCLSMGVLNLIFFLIEYWPRDESFTSVYFLVTNTGTVESFNNSDILLCSIFIKLFLICLMFYRLNLFSLFSGRIIILLISMVFHQVSQFFKRLCFLWIHLLLQLLYGLLF